MKPISRLQIVNHDPRTLQRWEWDRQGRTLSLAGMVIFLGDPGKGVTMDVEVFGKGDVLAGASVGRLLSRDAGPMPYTSFHVDFETDVEPPYRLRVQFMREGLPLAQQGMVKYVEAEIRPWVHRELPSSS